MCTPGRSFYYYSRRLTSEIAPVLRNGGAAGVLCCCSDHQSPADLFKRQRLNVHRQFPGATLSFWSAVCTHRALPLLQEHCTYTVLHV